MATYKIINVRDNGIMEVEWDGRDTTRHPIPLDQQGKPLTGAALDAWSEEQYQANVLRRRQQGEHVAAMRKMIDKPRTVGTK